MIEIKERFINGTDLSFKDISSEKARTYHFSQRSFTITEPLLLNVSASGGHRIFDANGTSHYVPSGWIHLEWTVKPDRPHFEF